MRLIDADALVNPLKLQAESFRRIGEWVRADALDDCIVEIGEQPTVGGWISVKGRLPENAEDVLVFMERDAWGDGDKVVRKREIGIGYQIAGRWHVDGCSRVTGLYWQYLPKPPKEDNDAGQ